MPGHGVIPIRTQAGNPYRPCPTASTKTAETNTPGRHRPGWPSSPRPPNAGPPPTTPWERCSSATPLYAPLRPRPHRRLLHRAWAPAPGRGLRRPKDGGAQPGQRRRLPAGQEPGAGLQPRLVRPGAPDPGGNQGGPPGPEPASNHQAQGTQTYTRKTETGLTPSQDRPMRINA